MTTRVLDNALDAAHSAAQAIGDGISELLPDQLVPARRKSLNRGRTLALVSTLVIVAAGILITTRQRLREQRSHQAEPTRSADDAVASSRSSRSSRPSQPGRKAEREMSQADRANGEPAALRV